MSKERDYPEFLKRMPPARFVPLQEIDCGKEYYLSRFVDKLLKSSNKTRIKAWQVKKLWLYDKGLRRIFHDIALIVSRINQDGSGYNRGEELLSIAHSRRWTHSEEDEMESLDHVVSFVLLDVRSLLVFLMIFMDKLARFLAQIMNKNGKQVEQRSFHAFKDELQKLQGDEIEEFAWLIIDNTRWFEDVMGWRDEFVVHHPGAGGAMVFRDGRGYVALTRSEGEDKEPKYIIMNSQAVDIAIDEIDGILCQLKELLKILDEYLCSHINILPIEACIK